MLAGPDEGTTMEAMTVVQPDVHDGTRCRLAADVRGDESWTAAAPFAVTITPGALFAT